MISSARFAGLGLPVLVAAAIAPCQVACGETAVEVAFGAPDSIFPNGNTTHGWQFSVNATIEITHLGLYDRFLDGFALAHPIGLWDDAGTLLAQETIGPGVGDLLIDNFQYLAIGGVTNEAGSVILTPGIEYTIAFFTSVFVQSDGMVIFDGFHTINPIIDYVGFGLSEFTDGLQMPTDPDPGFHRWGPNFLFDVVIPAPTAAPLVGGAALWRRRRRRRRS